MLNLEQIAAQRDQALRAAASARAKLTRARRVIDNALDQAQRELASAGAVPIATLDVVKVDVAAAFEELRRIPPPPGGDW